jgi:hypothetical protein
MLWAEIWDDIKERIRKVYQDGEAWRSTRWSTWWRFSLRIACSGPARSGQCAHAS